MPWFNVDDGMHSHPKTIAAGNAAMGLWARFGSYSAKYSTEGHIPREIAAAFGTRAELRRLLAAGYLHEVDGGYQMHDFLDYNRDAAKVARDRAKAAERKRRQRERDKDESHGVTSDVTDGVSHSPQDQDQDQTGTTGSPPPQPTSPVTGDGGACGKRIDDIATAYGQLALEQAKANGVTIGSDSGYRNSAAERIRRDEAERIHQLAEMFPTAANTSIAAAVLTGDTRPLAPHAT